MTPKIEGTIVDGYEPVRSLFEENFRRGREENAQLCVYVGKEKVVDLWGVRNPSSEEGKAYGPDKVQMIFSSTKSITAIAVACAVDKGWLSYDEKISKYWPEFGQNGKKNVTLAEVLRHEAGMAYLQRALTFEELSHDGIKANKVGKVLEEEKQHFPPEKLGSDRDYHACTRGVIMNEVFRRVHPKGSTIGEFLREEVCGPLGIGNAFVIGATKEEAEANWAKLTGLSTASVLFQAMMPAKLRPNAVELGLPAILRLMSVVKKMGAREDEPNARPPFVAVMEGAGKAPMTMVEKIDCPDGRQTQMPSNGGGASARGMARLAAAMASKGQLDGVRVMSEETWGKFHENFTPKKDVGLFGTVTLMSQGGVNKFDVHEDDSQLSMPAKKDRVGFVGWSGFGGSVFQWDIERKIGFGYAPTRLNWYDFCNVKAGELQAKVRECVDKIAEKAE